VHKLPSEDHMRQPKPLRVVYAIRPEDVFVDIWQLAISHYAINDSAGGVEHAKENWPQAALLVWYRYQHSAIMSTPRHVTEADVFSSYHLSARASAILYGYMQFMSFMDEVEVICQYTVDREAVYRFYWPDLQEYFPSFYSVMPQAAADNYRHGAIDAVERQIHNLLPGHPIIRQLDEIHESIPGVAERNRLFDSSDLWYEGWKLPAQL
jgi:hypothetical protein